MHIWLKSRTVTGVYGKVVDIRPSNQGSPSGYRPVYKSVVGGWDNSY